MNYLTLELIKKQLNMNDDFTEDDLLLNQIGNAAEQRVAAHLQHDLSDLMLYFLFY